MILSIKFEIEIVFIIENIFNMLKVKKSLPPFRLTSFNMLKKNLTG
jgi:hypothetical protein